jgi:dTDP-4-amino-4,6-dideoxygalactose transaminase
MELTLDDWSGPAGRLPAGAWVDSGRSAIRLALRQIQARGRRVALLPDYLCESILQPFCQEGWRVRFFRVEETLRIDLADLRAAVARHAPALVLFIQYFGFPVSAPERAALQALRREHGLLLIEDCVQGSLLEGTPAVGDIGDFVVTSVRKYTAAPDGGLLRRRGRAPSAVAGAPSPAAHLRLVAKLNRGRALAAASPRPAEEQAYLDMFAQAEQVLEKVPVVAPLSPWSRALLARHRWRRAGARRRANFRMLQRAFAADPGLRRIGTPLYAELPPGVAPLAFPIRVRDGRRDALRAALARRRVYAPVHWPLPRAIPAARRAAHRLAEEELSLPLDQRYQKDDLQHLLRQLRQAWRDVS